MWLTSASAVCWCWCGSRWHHTGQPTKRWGWCRRPWSYHWRIPTWWPPYLTTGSDISSTMVQEFRYENIWRKKSEPEAAEYIDLTWTSGAVTRYICKLSVIKVWKYVSFSSANTSSTSVSVSEADTVCVTGSTLRVRLVLLGSSSWQRFILWGESRSFRNSSEELKGSCGSLKTLVLLRDSNNPHQLHRSSKNMMSWFIGRDWSVGGALCCLISYLQLNLEQFSCSA